MRCHSSAWRLLATGSRLLPTSTCGVRNGLRVLLHEKHLRDIPLEDGFTRPCYGGLREINIHDGEHIRRAEPLLRAAYDSLVESREHADSP